MGGHKATRDGLEGRGVFVSKGLQMRSLWHKVFGHGERPGDGPTTADGRAWGCKCGVIVLDPDGSGEG